MVGSTLLSKDYTFMELSKIFSMKCSMELLCKYIVCTYDVFYSKNDKFNNKQSNK